MLQLRIRSDFWVLLTNGTKVERSEYDKLSNNIIIINMSTSQLVHFIPHVLFAFFALHTTWVEKVDAETIYRPSPLARSISADNPMGNG